MRAVILFGVVLSAVGPSCGPSSACTSGASVGCVCTSGRMGAQTCRADGTFGTCVCDGDPDAGVPELDGGELVDAPIDPGTDAPAIDAGGSDAGGADAGPRTGFVALSTGGSSACAIWDDARTYCWSRTDLAQPCAAGRPMLAANGVRDVSVGDRHVCAALTGGTVQCWGRGGAWLGVGDTAPRPTPTTVPGLSGVVDVAAGSGHTCALRDVGNVLCWGNGTSGELGNGGTATSDSPVGVVGFTDGTAIAAAARGGHTCALRAGGRISCWGSNPTGAIGNGGTGMAPTPSEVPGLTGAIAVAAGSAHTCAAFGDGHLECWGLNTAGELGNASTSNATSPVRVMGIDDAIAVTAGDEHTCALHAGGTVSCWGDNDHGQLGDGTLGGHTVPTAVPALSGVVAIAAGGYFTCAILADGGATCWGENMCGQLGDGTLVESLVPVDLDFTP